jgi:hypothetical protein
MNDPDETAMEIITFLTARIDAAERTLWPIVSRRAAFAGGVRATLDGGWNTWGEYGRMIKDAFNPELMLAEVRAKRSRITLHTFVQAPDMWRPLPEELPAGYTSDFIGWCDMCSRAGDYAPWPCLSLRLEAAPYIDADAFKLDWRVDATD